MTALAVPLALAVEYALHRAFQETAFGALRTLLHRPATGLAWACAVAAVPLAIASRRVLAASARRQTESIIRRGGDPAAHADRIRTAAFVAASSIVQIPALFAVIAYALGAAEAPVFAAAALSTGSVLAQGRAAA